MRHHHPLGPRPSRPALGLVSRSRTRVRGPGPPGPGSGAGSGAGTGLGRVWDWVRGRPGPGPGPTWARVRGRPGPGPGPTWAWVRADLGPGPGPTCAGSGTDLRRVRAPRLRARTLALPDHGHRVWAIRLRHQLQRETGVGSTLLRRSSPRVVPRGGADRSGRAAALRRRSAAPGSQLRVTAADHSCEARTRITSWGGRGPRAEGGATVRAWRSRWPSRPAPTTPSSSTRWCTGWCRARRRSR